MAKVMASDILRVTEKTTVETYLSVGKIELNQTQKGVDYYIIHAYDRSGTIKIKDWNVIKNGLPRIRLYQENLLRPKVHIYVSGLAEPFNGEVSINLWQSGILRIADPDTDDYDPADLARPSSRFTFVQLVQTIGDLAVDEVKNPRYRELNKAMMRRYLTAMKGLWAGESMHGAYENGYLEHVANSMLLNEADFSAMQAAQCEMEGAGAPDRDLTHTGTAWHDAGKLRTYTMVDDICQTNPLETKVGHTFMGVWMAMQLMTEEGIALSDREWGELTHTILAHAGAHGRLPTPATPEALILAESRKLARQIAQYQPAMNGMSTEEAEPKFRQLIEDVITHPELRRLGELWVERICPDLAPDVRAAAYLQATLALQKGPLIAARIGTGAIMLSQEMLLVGALWQQAAPKARLNALMTEGIDLEAYFGEPALATMALCEVVLADAPEINEELLYEVMHLTLSMRGTEQPALPVPQTPSAFLVHQADLMESRFNHWDGHFSRWTEGAKEIVKIHGSWMSVRPTTLPPMEEAPSDDRGPVAIEADTSD